MKTIDIAGNPVELDLDDDEVVLDALVIMRVTRLSAPPGTSAIVTAATPATDYITQVGMMDVACHVLADEQNGGDD